MSDRNALPRRLRQAATPAEQRLWTHLRDRRFEGAKFRRQRPIGRHVVDFACIEAKLVVELEGGVHRLREAEDAQRQRIIEAEGWRVLVLPNDLIFSDIQGALNLIRSALRNLPAP